MLVNATNMLLKARDGHYGVGQFNINNLEWTRSILLQAQAMQSPVILPCWQSRTARSSRALHFLTGGQNSLHGARNG